MSETTGDETFVSVRRGTARLGHPYRVKPVLDYILAVLLLPVFAAVSLALFVLNPVFNRGPVFFRQVRMGYRGAPFVALKFRSMTVVTQTSRGAFDALEEDRITTLGRILRASRIDELPQIINVLRGEMSMIGPRPDAYDHACDYEKMFPDYLCRYDVKPGISGYAQTEVGYVDTMADVRRKIDADLVYLSKASFRFDLWIVWRTLAVVFGRQGR
ncbi:Sugar transferase involved in LPS biosynthesis (colanic, teichoic acid) [Yoonia litorea]|uniref:Sugar transferase involved in LPS biosynthesis (Colanic, teichoic acid) n=2 Tax=Yoonia litorea TaxID=1123755 RepID=A0A1I6LDP1_9RHOB|nr:Sugar transferase involved in LPS biosynthesis (colanic, teichoic acid) [Yoonia litorea]